MLPPVEESVLKSNPEFAALHSTLTTAILNSDGTTKDDQSRAAREREAELDVYRLKSAKQHLLAQAISSAAPPEPRTTTTARRGKPSSTSLPEPLLDLLLLLPPLLTNAEQLSQESLSLLLSSPPFSSLDDLLPELASLVSSNLQSSAVQLARAANSNTNASFLHRHISSVPKHISTLSSAASQQFASLAKARLAAANSLITLLDRHAQALTSLIRSLEAKHGGVARSLELRAAEVALEAQRGEMAVETVLWNVRRDVYTPEVRDALRNYADHVRDGQRRLREAARAAEAELGEYGVQLDDEEGGDPVRERRFREIARAHRDVRRQIDEAKRDLSRLR
ncbi:hypothetical protein M406DRAFT_38081 [Cryphonectria parasitica EP155]|uniref:Uncharacterized protein n=1 Tax=Cryphonectria parasitica (strain ATCC 38755 / EP155) TaxID=660469 RepID=A0A9P4Y2X6_CRYP1|nr:uncharacterized protein M406DRAFT_38081 [Cryphonectria parasitica EP155]KAF3765984.1 hypothetical protein M406DRAFT_38081 [Cryphonectria parasitica EP155]